MLKQIDSTVELTRHNLSNPFGEADAKDFRGVGAVNADSWV